MKTIESKYGQTSIDVAIQEYGCYEGLFLLLEDNPNVSLGGDLIYGTLINIRDEVPELTANNRTIVAELKNKIVVSGKLLQEGSNSYVEDGYVEDGYVE